MRDRAARSLHVFRLGAIVGVIATPLPTPDMQQCGRATRPAQSARPRCHHVRSIGHSVTLIPVPRTAIRIFRPAPVAGSSARRCRNLQVVVHGPTITNPHRSSSRSTLRLSLAGPDRDPQALLVGLCDPTRLTRHDPQHSTTTLTGRVSMPTRYMVPDRAIPNSLTRRVVEGHAAHQRLP